MTRVLKTGDKPEAITLCSASKSDSGVIVNAISGAQVLYGNAGPRCEWDNTVVTTNGGLTEGIVHGSLSGSC
jgi:hypothetical protein